ncbi:hypothetical protein DDQ41_17015 [Streptomyces spongiicola]|uniref:Uncharacterized protein n=1 Tax=Streptomyces spongiicola TaxID=1690221 RepID=A0ABN5KJB4_9ACTN|nr:hypothetical protein DDQ41_17015 [Streptomyces spongiicola]
MGGLQHELLLAQAGRAGYQMHGRGPGPVDPIRSEPQCRRGRLRIRPAKAADRGGRLLRAGSISVGGRVVMCLPTTTVPRTGLS